MYEFNKKLLYNEKKLYHTRIEFLNFKITLPFQVNIQGLRLVSNGLISWDDILVDIQLEYFLLLSNINELSMGPKNKKFENHHRL